MRAAYDSMSTNRCTVLDERLRRRFACGRREAAVGTLTRTSVRHSHTSARHHQRTCRPPDDRTRTSDHPRRRRPDRPRRGHSARHASTAGPHTTAAPTTADLKVHILPVDICHLPPDSFKTHLSSFRFIWASDYGLFLSSALHCFYPKLMFIVCCTAFSMRVCLFTRGAILLGIESALLSEEDEDGAASSASKRP